MKPFAARLLIFLMGLAAIARLTDTLVGRWADSLPRGYLYLIGGPDVHLAVYHAGEPGAQVRTIYLGDSVSRQLFTPGTEPAPRLRYLSSNRVISIAGQYYLLRRALENCPGTREVDLFCHPDSWANDLPKASSADYFCGYFHSPRQVLETFEVTGDWDLLASHVERCLLPNILAANKALHLQMSASTGEEGTGGSERPDPEPLLASLTWLTQGRRTVSRARTDPVPLSNVSRVFLLKMRALCRQRGIQLRVLPCPCSSARIFRCPPGLYDAPVVYFPPAEFIDGLHFAKQWLEDARRRVVAEYGLERGE